MKTAWPDQETAPVQVQSACPFCRSSKIMTTSVKADASAWRCEACGQVWNVARLRPSHRRGQGRWAS
jgi:transposase-like protein